jgi:hypothetical protein
VVGPANQFFPYNDLPKSIFCTCGPPDIVVALAHVCLHEAVEIHILNQPVARHTRTIFEQLGAEPVHKIMKLASH